MNTHLLARAVLWVGMFVSFGCTSAPSGGVNPPPIQELNNNTNKPYPPTTTGGTLASIERLDPALDALLAKDAQAEILVGGLDWCEGPVWVPAGSYLLFSDVPQNVVYKWKEGEGVKAFMKPSGYWGATPRGGEPGSNGLTLDHQGRLTLCQHGERRVARVEKDSSITTIADRYDGKRLNSPNDLCYDTKGNLYFTDPPYGLEKRLEDPKKELAFQGVYRVTPDGKISLATNEIKFPNGIALSPDERTLYVAESNPEKPVIWSFRVKEDGTLADKRVFFDAGPMAARKLKGLPDGMKVDNKGNLWATGPGGVLIITPEGKHLGTILTGQATANCAWGDDGSTLYIMADMYVARVKTKTMGTMPGK
jgi:gluconolactonase